MSWNLAFSARPGVLPASLMTCSDGVFHVLSGATIQIPLCSSLAADEASQLPGRAVPAHRVLHPLQAHGRLRLHCLQRLRRRAALGLVRALQQAGSLPHHYVQQRGSPVGPVVFSSFFGSQALRRCRLGTAALFRDGSYIKYLISYMK